MVLAKHQGKVSPSGRRGTEGQHFKERGRKTMPSITTANLNPGVHPFPATVISGPSNRYQGVDEDQDNNDEEENGERGNWSGKLDFLLSCLGYAVGLGNVWRFPYLCYRNGGGAFFVPYFIMLVFVGIPLFFMEVSLGQFCSNGPLTCWTFAPLFKGVGVAQLVVSGLVSIYYNVIIAWAFYYFCASFTSKLPWSDCYNEWNTKYCIQIMPDVTCEDAEMHQHDNGTCYNTTGHFLGLWNYTIFNRVTGGKRYSASEEYYTNKVMTPSGGIEDMGTVKWDLTMCLMGAWFTTFICMIKGIKSSGKVVYFTALFPYIVLFILLCRGASLPNAGEGVKFYITPKWDRLADAKVWKDAAVQIFFSLSNCWGGLIALSSYNRFHNNCFRDALLVSIGNCSTSIFAGFVIFSFLGFMAKELNTSVEKVVDSGPGLAFVVYPDAVTRMTGSPLWSVLFFAMVITLGLDSQFALLETVLTSLTDQFRRLRARKTEVTLGMCCLFFLLGLSLCSHGGTYMLVLMDTYCAGWAILIIGLCESIAVGWIYGCPRFFSDISLMLGKKPAIWWRLCLQGFCPALITFILLFAWIDYSPARYGSYKYPTWAEALGWMMSFASVTWIVVIAVYKLLRVGSGSFLQDCCRVYHGPCNAGYLIRLNATKLTEEEEEYMDERRISLDGIDTSCRGAR